VIAALFDFDGTLYTGHIWQDLARHHWAARRQRRWVVAYVASNMAALPLYRLGILSQTAFFHRWAETMGWLLRGWTPEEAEALFRELADVQIMPNLRPEVMGRLRQHLSQEHLVALVSGTFAQFLTVIARPMSVQHAIGTPLEVQNGHYTGRLVHPLCQGTGKPARVQDYLGQQKLAIDWANSFAYADRYNDLPLLDLVGHPVAVHPDERLLSHAEQHGWTILDGSDR
jgi:HAD superfamily hydrolase (TIGR01490 family)